MLFCKLIYIPYLKNWRIHEKNKQPNFHLINLDPSGWMWISRSLCASLHLTAVVGRLWPHPDGCSHATVGLSKGESDVKDIQGRRVKWWHRPPLNHSRWWCCVISGSCLVDTLSHVVCVGRWRSKDMTEKCLHSWDADGICEMMWLIRNSKIDDSNFPVPTVPY